MLDVTDPDWFSKIRVNELDLEDCYECVLGQLYDNYHHACKVIGMSEKLAVVRGFNVQDADAPYHVIEKQFTYMTYCWKQKIVQRREEVTGMNIGEESPAIVVEPIDVPSEVEEPSEVPAAVPDEVEVPA